MAIAARAYLLDVTGERQAESIAFAIEQPHDVDINDIVLRPAAQEF